jgi:NDP-sugar pyrophosphorylase family protein
LVVGPGHDRQAVVQLMAANEIQQIPVVDARRRVIGLHIWDRLNRANPRPNVVVIMAGGEGRRLRPITNNRPKPMVEVGGKPLLEHIILKARQEGFHRFVIAVRHLGEMIERHFGNGKSLGVDINYCREKKPLGTAGALRLLSPTPHPILVTNGDVLADFSYLSLLDFHIRHRAAATMAVRSQEWVNPFGVVETKGLEIVGFKEKPVVRSHINAGVYVLDPAVRRLIPRGRVSVMPEIFSVAKARGMAVLAYPLHEPWLDVGSPEDLAKAKALRTGQS